MKPALLLSLTCILLFSPILPAEETLALRELRQLVAEGKRILSGSQLADGSFDEPMLERRFQHLIHKYDAFIHLHSDFAPGYVAYASILEQIGQAKAARTMYLKANQLDPNIPLVKNQLGNFLVEEGNFADALPYFLAAIELDPTEPLYHYQLGNLLHEFRDGFLEKNIFNRETIDSKMLAAFEKAANLAPAEIAYTYRHAEAFYDLANPRWEEALRTWEKIEQNSSPGLEKQTILLHKAKVLLHLNKPEEARTLIQKVKHPLLSGNRERLLSEFPQNTGSD